MSCAEVFERVYHRSPEGVAFCPYRVCPIGAHVDHQLGKITGFAIDKGISVAYAPSPDGIVEVCSMQFEKAVRWHVGDVPEKKQNDWADYLRGATLALSENHHLETGLSAVVEGSLPIGGLSSSAAVILSFLSALCSVNNIHLEPLEAVLTAQRAENAYVGVSCGKLDQSCEVYSKKNSLLYLDTKTDEFELIPASPAMKPYKIAIFYSGLSRSLAGSKFNMRVDECRAAAYSVMAFEGIEYGRFGETNLRDVPYELYLKHKSRLPADWAKRAEHCLTEFDRVERGAEAWRNGDIELFGRLSFESGNSSIVNYETGSPELKALYEIMTRTDGIYGGRFSGAGFRGCCMALIDPAFEESITERVTAEYCKVFPEYADRFSVHICETADGVGLDL